MNSKFTGILFLLVSLFVVLFIGQWLYLGGSYREGAQTITTGVPSNVLTSAVTRLRTTKPPKVSTTKQAKVKTTKGKVLKTTNQRIAADERMGTRQGTNVPKRYLTTEESIRIAADEKTGKKK